MEAQAEHVLIQHNMKAKLTCIKCAIEVGTLEADGLQDGIMDGIQCAAIVEDTPCGGEIYLKVQK